MQKKDQYIYLNGMLDVLVAGETDENGTIPLEVSPSIITTTPTSVWARIDTSFIDALPDLLLDVDISKNEEIATGPLLMRIRYDKDSDGNPIPPKGKIISGSDGGLMVELTLDVYLDAPYLNPSIGPANLEHNLRSYPINDLKLRGAIKFMEDGRMQITLANLSPILIDVEVRGKINITPSNTGGLCGSVLFGWLCEAVANGVIDANTRIRLEISKEQLYLNYISPFTQH